MEMFLEITLRLFVALLLGGFIGLEREYRSKEAGFRTHFLVALGSALFCIVSQYGFGFDMKDSSRVAAQVVSGIGFLGAGTIIFQKNMVRGLTTAAGLWVTAAIGLACGTGMYMAAGIATTMVLLGLEVLHALIPKTGANTMIVITFTAPTKTTVLQVLDKIKQDCQELYTYELKEHNTAHGSFFEVKTEIRAKRSQNKHFLEYMNRFKDVTIASIE